MKTYKAPTLQDPVLRELTAQIEQASNRADPDAELQYLHTEPARLRKGMLVLADGTDWDPGSGAGLYLRDEDNAAWTFLGSLSAEAADADLRLIFAVQTEQLKQLTKIYMILSTVTGIVINDGDVTLQSGQLQQLTNIALLLSSMAGASVDAFTLN